MPRYEYKVVPAPAKGLKGKGLRGPEARFSFAIEELMNAMAGEGWEYQRAETLPSIERAGLTGTTTEWRNVLIFRRPHSGEAEAFKPELLPAPEDDIENAAQETETESEKVVSLDTRKPDNGVEDTEPDAAIGPSLSLLARARGTLTRGAQNDEDPKT